MKKEKIINIIKFKEKESYYILTGLIITGLSSYGLYSTSKLYNHVYNGVSVGSISVGGLTKEELKNKLSTYYEKILNKKTLIIDINNTQIEYSLSDFGVSFNIDEMSNNALSANKKDNLILSTLSRYSLYFNPTIIPSSYSIDEDKLNNLVDEIINTHSIDAINAQFTYGDGKIEVTEKEKQGLSFNRENLTSEFKNGIINAINKIDTPSTTTLVDANVNVGEPEIIKEKILVSGETIDANLTADAVSKMTLLGHYSSQLPSTTNGRGKNVILFSSRITDTVVMPGEEFSISDTAGEIESWTGYYPATTFINSKPVDAIGGGVCQVVSTLYNAVLYADLEVTERHQHSLTVGYVPLGRDATMYTGLKDFKFKNNTSGPLIVQAYVNSAGQVVTNIWGTDDHPERTIEISVKNLGNLTTETYKHTYENGELVKTEFLHRDKYKQ